MKIFIRTIFYQFFLLFVGGSLGFIFNAEYVGWKSMLVARSFQHIFYPVEYDEHVEQFVLGLGRMRLAIAIFGHPDADLSGVLTDEQVWGEEFYDALYRDPADGDKLKLYQTRIRWKPWEYYYEYHSTGGDWLEDFLKPAPEPLADPELQIDPPAPPGPATPLAK